MKITKTYNNPNNGGKEKVIRDGDSFYIASDWGKGFCNPVQISREKILITLQYTQAPLSVMSILN